MVAAYTDLSLSFTEVCADIRLRVDHCLALPKFFKLAATHGIKASQRMQAWSGVKMSFFPETFESIKSPQKFRKNNNYFRNNFVSEGTRMRLRSSRILSHWGATWSPCGTASRLTTSVEWPRCGAAKFSSVTSPNSGGAKRTAKPKNPTNKSATYMALGGPS